MTDSPATRTAVSTTLAMVAFAGNSLLGRVALREDGVDPVAFTAVRLAAGALVLAPLLLRGSARRPWDLRATVALLVYAFPFSISYVSLDAGTGALLLFGSVQVTMIGRGIQEGERPGPRRVLGLVLAVGGLVWLVLPGVGAPDATGAALMIGAGIGWGAYSLRGRGSANPLRSTACNFVLAAPVGIFLALLFGEGSSLDGPSLGYAVCSGAITSGLGYVIWYAALRGHSATSAAIVQLSVPVIAALGGLVLLGEAATPRLLVGGGVTLIGITLAILAGEQRDAQSAES